MVRVHPSPEPSLKLHRYIVVCYPTKCRKVFRYCMNREEVRKIKRAQKKGTYIEVFKADHNFTEGWLA